MKIVFLTLFLLFFRGARHGLKATGKLARIAQQEALLLSQSKYSGYSHAKKLKEQVEDINLNSDSDSPERKKKKKKRKRCNSNEKIGKNSIDLAESEDVPLPNKSEVTDDYSVASVIKEGKLSRKSKKKKKDFRDIEVIPEEDEDVPKPKKKKKERENEDTADVVETNDAENVICNENKTKKKSKNKKDKSVVS